MTIFERALELVPNDAKIGIGSGRAARAFATALGERVRNGALRVQAVATSEETAKLCVAEQIPLTELAGTLDVAFDGADEVDPHVDLIKGYGRALVREKVVAVSARRLIILVDESKLVPQLGTRGRLPVEIVPFALPLCEQRLRRLGLEPTLDRRDGRPFVTDNGNYILDCSTGPIADAARLDADIRAIPGVVGTGLFLGIAELVLVGSRGDFELIQERHRD